MLCLASLLIHVLDQVLAGLPKQYLSRQTFRGIASGDDDGDVHRDLLVRFVHPFRNDIFSFFSRFPQSRNSSRSKVSCYPFSRGLLFPILRGFFLARPRQAVSVHRLARSNLLRRSRSAPFLGPLLGPFRSFGHASAA